MVRWFGFGKIMASITEKVFLAIAPKAFIADGGTYGEISVLGAVQFKVGQKVVLKSNTQPDKIAKIMRIPSETSIILGNPGKPISKNNRLNISTFLVSDSATIEMPEEQSRPTIDYRELLRAVYAEEPTMALRNLLVDEAGNPYSDDNPFPIVIDEVTIPDLNVSLKHNGETPQPNEGDTVAIGNNKTGADSRLLEVNKNLDIDIRAQGWTVEEKLKKGIMCAYDVTRDMTHTEIDGVRRITEIEWTSSSMNDEAEEVGFILGGQILIVRRTFTYQGADPFDLVEIDDELVVV